MSLLYIAMEEVPATDPDVVKIEPEEVKVEDGATAAATEGEGDNMDTEEQTTTGMTLLTQMQCPSCKKKKKNAGHH